MKKTYLIALITFFISLSSMAKNNTQKKEYLFCQNGYERIIVNLDSSGFDPNSGYKLATQASITYMYSSTLNMSCNGYIRFDKYDVNCVGYYYPREITELKIRSNNGRVIATWVTSEGYGNEDKETECVLKTL